MDDIRRFRLLVAPFVFFAWLAIGLWNDSTWHNTFVCALHKDSKLELAALVTLGLGVSLPLGFLIHQAGYCLAWAVHWLFRRTHLEALPDLCSETPEAQSLRKKVARKLKAEPCRENAHYVTAVLAYEIANKEVGQWIARSWSPLIIAANTAVALMLAVAVRWCVAGVCSSNSYWFWLTIVSLALLWAVGARSWRLTMGMVRLEAQRLP